MKKLACLIVSVVTCLTAMFALTACGKDFTVTLDANGGSVIQSTVEVTKGEEYELPVATREGYTFKGWKYNNEVISNTGTWSIKDDITVVASWEGNKYLVNFDAQGGALDVQSMDVVYGDNITLPTPTKSGFIFKGWKYNDEIITNGVWNKTEFGITLVAVWEAKVTKITYDVAGGVLIGNLTQDAQNGKPITFNQAIKSHSTLNGWKNEATGEVYGFSTVWNNEEEAVTLTAIWIKDTHVVNIDVNGGQGYEGEVTYTKECESEIEINTTGLYLSGYRLKGWKVNEELVSFPYVVNNDVTFTAVWEKISSNVTFDAKGGTTTETNKVIAWGDSYALTSPTKDGYTFAGWSYKDATGVRQVIENEGSWYVDLETVTLEAVWHGESCIVTFVDGDLDPKTYYESEPVTLPIPTKAGKKFLGWFNGDIEMPKGEFTWEITGEVTLTAKWEDEVYTITFEGNETKTCKYKDVYDFTELVPTKAGYEFLYWLTQDGEEVYAKGIWKVEKDVTLTAVFLDVDVDEDYGPNS